MAGQDHREIGAGDLYVLEAPPRGSYGLPAPTGGNWSSAAARPADCCRSDPLARDVTIGSITMQSVEMTAVYRQGGYVA